MAWLKVDQTILDHEKTIYLAQTIGMDEVHVIGHLFALWSWALDNRPDGNLRATDRLIVKACRWEDDQISDKDFVEALIAAGFLDVDTNGNRTIHDWEEYSGELIRRREANKKRMRESRKKGVK